tara:strand:- start:8680 stop:9564 length:885 start_codon:yes stop_codon:yes gene_type:complete
MNRMGLSPNNKPKGATSKYPSMQCGTGVYAQAASTAHWDNWTSYTIATTYCRAYAQASVLTNAVDISIAKTDSNNIFAADNGSGYVGAYFNPWKYNMTYDGGSVVSSGAASGELTTASISHSKTSSFGKTSKSSAIGTNFIRVNCETTSNNVTSSTIVDGGFQSSDLDLFKTSSQSKTFIDNNWGALGTDGFITISGMRIDNGSVIYPFGEQFSFLRCQIWKNILLTDEQCKNTVGGGLGRTTLVDYNSEYAYPQPTHEYIPVIGNSLTIPDTGSGTALNLSYFGSPDIGFHRF